MKRLLELSALLQQFWKKYSFEESEKVIRLYNLEVTQQHFNTLKLLRNILLDIPGFNFYTELDIGDELDLASSYQSYEGGVVNIRIDKRNGEDLYFFTDQGLALYLTMGYALQGVKNVFSATIEKPFEALTVNFSPISEKHNETVNSSSLLLIKYLKPLNAEAQLFLAKDLTKWVTKVEYLNKCPDVWVHASSIRLLCSIGFEFSIDSEEIIVEIIGDRRKKIAFNADMKIAPKFFIILNEIASWIYIEVTDVDSRHNIFNYELGRNMADSLKLSDDCQHSEIFENAFENSKLAYRYHLINSSKELNKTLVELNKSLFEYISKIRQNTVDLINTLWKDFATAFGILILNFTIKKESVPIHYFNFLGIGICLYLVSSFFLSTRISFWFYKSLKKNLIEWRNRIYGYIGDLDFSNFTMSPLKKAQKSYLFTFWVVFALYLILICSILHFVLNIRIFKY